MEDKKKKKEDKKKRETSQKVNGAGHCQGNSSFPSPSNGSDTVHNLGCTLYLKETTLHCYSL